MANDRTILINGVTGHQGGAVAKALHAHGFHLRGLTRPLWRATASTWSTHRSKKRCPASVNASARVVRWSKRTPSRFSSAAMRRLRRVFSTPILRAAAEKPPYQTTDAKK